MMPRTEGKTVMFRLVPTLGALVIGTLCGSGILALVIRLNREPTRRPDARAGEPVSFQVERRKKKKTPEKIRRRPKPRQVARRSSAPVPVVGVGLSGIDFGLPAVAPGDLGELAGSLLQSTKDLKDVVMTKEAVDHLPAPVTRPAPSFPPRLHREGVMHGAVVVDLLIGSDGVVQDVKVLSSSHELFERSVLQVVNQWRFSPARYKGRPVPLSMRQTIRFSQS